MLSPEQTLDGITRKGINGTADQQHKKGTHTAAEYAPSVVAAYHKPKGLPWIPEPGERRVWSAARLFRFS